MNVLHERVNKLLKRHEVVMQLNQSTPLSHAQALEVVASHFKSSPENVAVKKIGSHYGSHHVTVEAFVYDSADHKKSIEPRVKEKKAKGAS